MARERDAGEMRWGGYLPKQEIGVRHEVGDALQPAPRLEHERRERHLVQVHPHSIHGVVSGARRGPHDRGAET